VQVFDGALFFGFKHGFEGVILLKATENLAARSGACGGTGEGGDGGATSDYPLRSQSSLSISYTAFIARL
jgi:hypothetical protein